MDCICQNCGRHFDCGEPEGLCELCQADKAALTKVTLQEEGPLESTTLRPYIVLSGDTVVREVSALGWQQATEKLSPSLEERLALILDIPRG